jgi:dTDP-4-dehydrorhamnose reductase
MRILLIGAAGQVGTDLLPVLRAQAEVVPTTRSGELAGVPCMPLDVSDAAAVNAAVERVRPDVVVNASAYTAVDRAESEPELADRVNHLAPRAMARACAASGARLVHYSTDYVFDGAASHPYSTDDPTAPSGAYGRTKAAGERAVRAAHPDALILRTAWVYSFHGANFLRTMLRLGAERAELRVVADQVGCPTPSWMIAETTAELLRKPELPSGIEHLVTRGRTSWHGFAEAIFEEASGRELIHRRPRVDPITTADYPTPARRPAWSVLDPTGLERLLDRPLPDWRAALAETFRRAVKAGAQEMR